RQPVAADQEDHRLAAAGRIVQRLLPALARRNAAGEVEEDVVTAPAVRDKPIGERHCLRVVPARMAEKDARQSNNTPSPHDYTSHLACHYCAPRGDAIDLATFVPAAFQDVRLSSPTCATLRKRARRYPPYVRSSDRGNRAPADLRGD